MMSKYQELLAMAATDTDGCMEWPHSLTAYGYPQVYDPDARRPRGGHAIVCEVAHGPRPEGRDAAHSCGVRACVNPRHLRWATRAENMADTVAHRTLVEGSRQHAAKLTELDVMVIRLKAKLGMSKTYLAFCYGVSYSTIHRILSGESWKMRTLDVN